jgi:hypothetical protein
MTTLNSATRQLASLERQRLPETIAARDAKLAKQSLREIRRAVDRLAEHLDSISPATP